MGLLSRTVSLLVHAFIALFVAAVLITVIPGIPPDLKFEAYSVVPPVNLDKYGENYALDKAVIHYDGKIVGPESVALKGDDDIVFTGDSQGNVIKILPNGDHSVVQNFQHSCGDGKENKCSWPLGMVFDTQGKLILVDHHGGIVKLDVDTGKWDMLVKMNTPVEGVPVRAPNDLDVARDGTIFFSDVSRHSDKYGYLLHEIYGEPSGRLIKYDQKSKTSTVLLNNIHFANGLCLSEDEDFVLISEIVQARILRYYLKGAKKGTHDVFIDGLPGIPDNIRRNGKGGFYVGIVVPWTDKFSLFHVERLGNQPYLRKFLLRSRLLLLSLLDGIKTLLGDNDQIQIAETYIQHATPLLDWSNLPKVGMVMELDKQGRIVNVMRSKKGEVYTISQFTLGKKYAYMTSPFNTKVWKMKLQDLQRKQKA